MLLRLASMLKRCIRVYSSGWCLRAGVRCPLNPKLGWSAVMCRSGVSTDRAVNGTVTSAVRVNNQFDVLFNVFISLLYMFRAAQCSSSGESIVSIHHLVYITQSDTYQMMY